MNNKNLANAQLLNSITSTDTVFEVKQGQGVDLPTAPFYATITPLGVLSTRDNSEIVQVTAVNVDELTVVRGQLDTTAKDFAADSVIANSIYVEDVNSKATSTDLIEALPETVGTAGKALVSDGTDIIWEDAGGPITISETPPPDAEEGDMWGDTSESVEVPKWVTNEMLADNSVDTPQLADEAVDTAAIQNGAVNTDKIDFTALDFEPNVTFNETPANRSFKRWGNLVIISYQGESKTHSNGELIFTLPVEARPSTGIYFPFTKNGNAYGYGTLGTNGLCAVNIISSNTATGRVVFNISYFV